VLVHQELIHPLPLSHQEVAHHLVATGQGLRLQLIERRLLLERGEIGGGHVNAVELRHAVIVIDAL
jgi:hypothetical protein